MTTLRNGATVLRSSPTPASPGIKAGEVVLAELPADEVSRFATWWVDLDGTAFWGHYFEADERDRAERDYADRTARGY